MMTEDADIPGNVMKEVKEQDMTSNFKNMEQIYIGFQSNHLTQLKLLADANWWMLPFEGELWLVKGKAVSESEEKGDYALLVSDMREVWIGFPSMDLSEEANVWRYLEI